MFPDPFDWSTWNYNALSPISVRYRQSVGDFRLLNMRFQQRIRLGGRRSIDGILEVFNLIDHSNFGTFTNDVDSTLYGRPVYNAETAYAARAAQLGFRIALEREGTKTVLNHEGHEAHEDEITKNRIFLKSHNPSRSSRSSWFRFCGLEANLQSDPEARCRQTRWRRLASTAPASGRPFQRRAA
jgi:hypothetical protein